MSNLTQRLDAADKRQLSRGEYDAISEIIEVVDRKARDLEDKWGVGRLPNLVPLEWAQKFHSQRRKLSEALVDWNLPEATKHGQAMERAFDVLDRLATEAGHKPADPEVWEFMVDDQLILLVRDRSMIPGVNRDGRKCQVWSLDEIASVIRNYPILAAAKEAFPGATIESIRPQKASAILDDDLEGLPF